MGAKNVMIEGAEVPMSYFSAEQKKDHRFVKRAVKEYQKLQAAKARFNTFCQERLLGFFDRKTEDNDQNKKTVYNISRDKRIIIRQPVYTKMSDLAVQAKRIIDDVLREYQDEVPEEISDVFGLLKGMFLEKKRMVFTPGISAFCSMKLKNKELLKAQELLRRSMEADIGKLSFIAEEKAADGSWKRVT